MTRHRSGHSLELAGYRHRIRLNQSGACRKCGMIYFYKIELSLSDLKFQCEDKN